MQINPALSLWKSICLLNISDKIALANCIFTGLFLLATIISVLCAFKAYFHQKNRLQKETACDLAKCYAEDILQHYLFVTDVLEDSKLGSRTKELFPYDELIEFTLDEMNSFLDRKGISYEKIRNEFENPDPKSILTAMRIHRPSEQERKDLFETYNRLLEEEAENKPDVSLLHHEFYNKMWEYLNALEWFSINCRYGIADEKILYQSLHQSFLSSVWQLYFFICNKNTTNENKYYTNTIWLFTEWRKRLNKIQKKAKKRQINAKKRLEKAEKKKRKAEDDLKKAKADVHVGTPLK